MSMQSSELDKYLDLSGVYTSTQVEQMRAYNRSVAGRAVDSLNRLKGMPEFALLIRDLKLGARLVLDRNGNLIREDEDMDPAGDWNTRKRLVQPEETEETFLRLRISPKDINDLIAKLKTPMGNS